MNHNQERDYSPVFFILLAIWIGIELLFSSGWLAIRPLLQGSARTGHQPGSLASLLERPRQATIPRVWFAPYTIFPEPGLIESRLRSGVYDTFLAFPSSGLATNFGALKLGPADLLFTQASSQGLGGEANLARQLGYQYFALDLGAIDQPDRVTRLCLSLKSCRLSVDGYALFRLSHSNTLWIDQLSAIHRLVKDFPQRVTAFRWAGVVLHPDQWFVPEGSDLVIHGDNKPRVRIWARASLSNSLYLYRDGDLSAPVANRLHTSQRRLWLILAPGLAQADLCWQSHGKSPCSLIRLLRHHPRREISSLIPPGQVITIHSLALYGAQAESIRLNQLPLLLGASQDRSVFGLEIE